MTTLQLQLPESLVSSLQSLAARENVSVDQLAATALSEKVAALMGIDTLQQRAARGDRNRYLAALGKVSDKEPLPPDSPVAGN